MPYKSIISGATETTPASGEGLRTREGVLANSDGSNSRIRALVAALESMSDVPLTALPDLTPENKTAIGTGIIFIDDGFVNNISRTDAGDDDSPLPDPYDAIVAALGSSNCLVMRSPSADVIARSLPCGDLWGGYAINVPTSFRQNVDYIVCSDILHIAAPTRDSQFTTNVTSAIEAPNNRAGTVREVISNIESLLTPGGVLVLSVPWDNASDSEVNELFPGISSTTNLFNWYLEEGEGGTTNLVNSTDIDGSSATTYTDVSTVGGRGTPALMRTFTNESLVNALSESFAFVAPLPPSDTSVYGDLGEFGVYWSDDNTGVEASKSQIIAALSPSWSRDGERVANTLANVGTQVAISDNTILTCDTDVGVQAWVRPNNYNDWGRTTETLPNLGTYTSGDAVALHQDIAVVGRPGANTAHVYNRNGDAWDMIPYDLGTAITTKSSFGTYVAVGVERNADNTLEYYVAVSDPGQGKCYVFYGDQSQVWGSTAWTSVATITPPGAPSSISGAVGISEGLLVLGDTGGNVTWGYTRGTGNTWDETMHHPGADITGKGAYGDSVTVRDGLVVVGDSVSNKLWAFHYDNETWSEEYNLGDGLVVGSGFGRNASIVTSDTHVDSEFAWGHVLASDGSSAWLFRWLGGYITEYSTSYWQTGTQLVGTGTASAAVGIESGFAVVADSANNKITLHRGPTDKEITSNTMLPTTVILGNYTGGGSSGSGGGAILFSDDPAEHWISARGIGTSLHDIVQTDHGLVAVGQGSSGTPSIYISSDLEGPWSAVLDADTLTQQLYSVANYGGHLVAVGSTGAFRSTPATAGTTWTPVSALGAVFLSAVHVDNLGRWVVHGSGLTEGASAIAVATDVTGLWEEYIPAPGHTVMHMETDGTGWVILTYSGSYHVYTTTDPTGAWNEVTGVSFGTKIPTSLSKVYNGAWVIGCSRDTVNNQYHHFYFNGDPWKALAGTWTQISFDSTVNNYSAGVAGTAPGDWVIYISPSAPGSPSEPGGVAYYLDRTTDSASLVDLPPFKISRVKTIILSV